MNLSLYITWQDIIFALIAGLAMTWVFYLILSFINKTWKKSLFQIHDTDLKAVLKKCYEFFPGENLEFNGLNLKRGMLIKVTTMNHKSYVGKLIGKNQQDMICILTARCIIAQELLNIVHIDILEPLNSQE